MEKSKKSKLWRAKYIINPRFQFFMIGFALIQSFLAIGILYALNVYFFHRFNSMGVASGIPSNHIYFQFLNEQQLFFGQAILVVSAVLGALIVGSVVVVSHRIAGPIYRMNKHIEEIAKGESPKEINFRKSDFFPEISEVFNKMVLKLKEERSQKNNDHAA